MRASAISRKEISTPAIVANSSSTNNCRHSPSRNITLFSGCKMKKYMQVFIVSILFLFFLILGCNPKKIQIIDTPPSAIGHSVLQKLRAEQFKEVENYIDQLVVEKPFSINGFRVLEEIYRFLSSREDIGEYIKKWAQTNSTHHSFYIIRGGDYKREAWKHRGGGWGYTVTNERMKSFKELLYLAMLDFEKAYTLNPKDPYSAASMIAVSKGIGLDEEIMEDWFKRAVDADFRSYSAYSYKLDYLAPKWRGTLEQYFDFAMKCFRKSPRKSVVHNVMLEYILERAKRSNDRKAFLNSKKIKKYIQEVTEKTLKDFPKSIYLQGYLARFKVELGEPEEAVKILTEAIEIDPNDTESLLHRSNIIGNFNLKQVDLAESDYKKIIKNEPYRSEAFFSLGIIYYQHKRDYKQSIEYLNTAISLDPVVDKYYFQRGVVEFGGNADYQAALKNFDEVVRLDPRYIEGYYARGRCLKNLNKNEEARASFQKALSLIEMEKSKGDAGSITPKRALSLSREIKSTLNYLLLTAESLTVEEALDLSKNKKSIELLKLKSITPEVAEIFANHESLLALKGLKSITPEVAEILSRHEGRIDLSGLKDINSEVACNLANIDGSLDLSGLTSISPEAAKELSKFKGKPLNLNGFTSISPPVAAHLSECPHVYLKGLTDVSNEVLVQLSKNRGTIFLDGLKTITPEAAKILASHEGNLFLNGLTAISPEIAMHLSKHNGGLGFGKIESLSAESARYLGKHKGFLHLYNIKYISDEVAKNLIAHDGEIQIFKLRSITPRVAELLCKVSRPNITLSSVKTISPEVAEILIKHEGVLFLGGLTELDIETAKILSKHNNEVNLRGLKVVSQDVMDVLRKGRMNILKNIKVVNNSQSN